MLLLARQLQLVTSWPTKSGLVLPGLPRTPLDILD